MAKAATSPPRRPATAAVCTTSTVDGPGLATASRWTTASPSRATTSVDITAPRRRASWRRCRCGRHRPGRARSIRPMKVSTLSVVPVTSKTNESVLASITLARNTSARRSASTRFSPVLLTLISASSRSICGPSMREVVHLVHRHQPVELRLDLLDHHRRAGGDDGDARQVLASRRSRRPSGSRCCSRGRRTGRPRGRGCPARCRPARRWCGSTPARDLLTPAPCLLRTPAWRRGRRGPAACRNAPRPTGSSGSSSPSCRRRRRR